jgi:hypothetical protein
MQNARTPHSYFKGSLLVEVCIAAALTILALFMIYLGFMQASRLSQRNGLLSAALNVLASEIDADAKRTFSSLAAGEYTAPLSLATLPKATISRSVVFNPPSQPITKTIEYTLEWDGNAGKQQLKGSYLLIEKGLTND